MCYLKGYLESTEKEITAFLFLSVKKHYYRNKLLSTQRLENVRKHPEGEN